jgi:hypothetical protein
VNGSGLRSVGSIVGSIDDTELYEGPHHFKEICHVADGFDLGRENRRAQLASFRWIGNELGQLFGDKALGARESFGIERFQHRGNCGDLVARSHMTELDERRDCRCSDNDKGTEGCDGTPRL